MVVQVVTDQLVVLHRLAVTLVLVVLGGVDGDGHRGGLETALARAGEVAAEPQTHVHAVAAWLEPQLGVDHRLVGDVLEAAQHHGLTVHAHGNVPGLARFEAVVP